MRLTGEKVPEGAPGSAGPCGRPRPQSRGVRLMPREGSTWVGGVPSLFGKVIIANAVIIVFGTMVGTLSSSLLSGRYQEQLVFLFVVAGACASVAVNYLLMRAAFGPLYDLLRVMQCVRDGELEARAGLHARDREVYQLASVFNAVLDQLEGYRRKFSSLILRAQEDERIRIARELHDETSQALTTLLIRMEMMEGELDQSNPGTAEKVAQLKELVTRTLTDLRRLIYELRPSILDDLGLIPAIRWLVREKLEKSGVETTLQLPNDLGHLTSDQTTALYRVLQEAATNILKHARATRVDLVMEQQRDRIVLRIQDNGQGFVTAGVAGRQPGTDRGLGLLGMRERLTLLGGRLSIRSSPGQGTEVRAELPVSGV